MNDLGRKIIPGMLILLTILGCGSADKRMQDSPEFREIVQEIKDLDFEIENEWALPRRYNRENLLGNANRIKFENDSVNIFLPFFGERHAGGGYNDQGAIQFKGKPKDLQIEENPEKRTVNISFSGSQNTDSGSQNTENLDFDITVFSNRRTRTSVTSSQRDMISYDGRVIRLE